MSGRNSTASDTGDARPRARPETRAYTQYEWSALRKLAAADEHIAANVSDLDRPRLMDLLDHGLIFEVRRRDRTSFIITTAGKNLLSDGALGRQDETPPLLRDEP